MPHGHSDRDAQALEAAGVDPHTRQPRERSVPCRSCGRATWNLTGACDAHYLAPLVARVERELVK